MNTYIYRIKIYLYSPADCKVDDWSAWGDCSATCNGGTKTKTRNIIDEPSLGGFTCPDLEKTQLCNTEQCDGILWFLLNLITTIVRRRISTRKDWSQNPNYHHLFSAPVHNPHRLCCRCCNSSSKKEATIKGRSRFFFGDWTQGRDHWGGIGQGLLWNSLWGNP